MKKELKSGKTSIHYRIVGQGPHVVLLHGFLESAKVWDDLVRNLSTEFTFIMPDLPGHGDSPSFAPTHGMKEIAGLISAILETEKVKDFVLVGHSMGGYVALALASQNSDHVKGLCLFHSQAGADGPEAMSNRLRTINAIEEQHTGFIRQFIPDLFAEHNVDSNQDTIAWLQSEAAKMKPSAIVASIRGMMERDDMIPFLEGSGFPVLFIAGAHDKRIPYSTVFAQASQLDHAEILLLKNIGHMGWAEDPHTCQLAIQHFAYRCFHMN